LHCCTGEEKVGSFQTPCIRKTRRRCLCIGQRVMHAVAAGCHLATALTLNRTERAHVELVVPRERRFNTGCNRVCHWDESIPLTHDDQGGQSRDEELWLVPLLLPSAEL